MTSTLIPTTLVGDCVEIEFDENIYSLDVIQRASLKFTDMASIAITRHTEAKLCARISMFHDAHVSADDLKKILVNEVLDQSLRERIAEQTAVERNLILSYTFSRSKLVAG